MLGAPFAAQAVSFTSGIVNQVVPSNSSYDVRFDNSLVDFTILTTDVQYSSYTAVSGPGTTMFVNSNGSPPH